jgi:hypothetical protein
MKEEDNRDANKEESIYRDLSFTTQLYLMSEQVFPLWENIYSVIVGAFFITYFTASSLSNIMKMILCIIGAFFCINWFRIVSRNHLFSRARQERITRLLDILQFDIPLNEEGTEKIKLFDGYATEYDYVKKEERFWNKTSSWYLRKALPKYLSIIWVLLLLYTLSQIINLGWHKIFC